MPTAYLASAFGFTESTRAYMRTVVVPILERVGIAVVNPWDLTPDEEVQAAVGSGDPSRLAALRRIIGERNAASIRACDWLIANLDGQELDGGVCWEMGFAYGLGKPVFAWRDDFRASGELGGRVNLQVAFGVTGDIEPSLQALVARLLRETTTHG
jgi:nucleoside 2-deoxyribosyltransferase